MAFLRPYRQIAGISQAMADSFCIFAKHYSLNISSGSVQTDLLAASLNYKKSLNQIYTVYIDPLSLCFV
jgi:hypothetical protein